MYNRKNIKLKIFLSEHTNVANRFLLATSTDNESSNTKLFFTKISIQSCIAMPHSQKGMKWINWCEQSSSSSRSVLFKYLSKRKIGRSTNVCTKNYIFPF